MAPILQDRVLARSATLPGFIWKHSLLPLHLWLHTCADPQIFPFYLSRVHTWMLWACIVMLYWILLVLSFREWFSLAIYCFSSYKYNKIKIGIRKQLYNTPQFFSDVGALMFAPWFLRDVISSWNISVTQLVHGVSSLFLLLDSLQLRPWFFMLPS